jgi:hypothetical protein
MTAEICDAGLLELGFLVDRSRIRTWGWLTTAIHTRAPLNGSGRNAHLRRRA